MKIDLSLTNEALYSGCEITEVAGRKNLETTIAEAVNIVGRNITAMLDGRIFIEDGVGRNVAGDEVVPDRRSVTLTGPMAVWAYLVVFHAVVHRFNVVYYDDGRSGPVVVAQHGHGA